MIKTFADKSSAALFLGLAPRCLPSDLRKRAKEKLYLLHAATALDDLRAPPANRLQALKGKRSGQHSLRINDQWRLCFSWRAGDAYDVEIVDYH